MAVTLAASPKRRGWLRILAWLLVALIILVVVLYFVATSSAFFKGVILPKVSKSLNATVTVSDATISPFSQVVLHDVKVQTTGPEPLLTATEVRLAYHLGDILRGNYHVDEVLVDSPRVQLITNPDGTSNLDPILKSAQQKPSQPAAPSKPSAPSAPPNVDIAKVVLTNATVLITKNYTGGNRDFTSLTNANVTLSNLKNGQTGTMSLTANTAIDNHPPAPASPASLQATTAGNFSFTLTPDLKPSVITGNTHVTIDKSGGTLADLVGLVVNFDCDLTPTELKQVTLRFQQNGNNLGQIRASGPFDAAKTEGHLKVEVSAIDHRVLNLVALSSGIDFTTTTIDSTSLVDLSKGGSVIDIAGQFNALKMALKRNADVTPTLDIRSDYHVTVDRAANSALLQKFDLTGTQSQKPLLHAELTSPMTIAWGGASNAVGDSALKLSVTNFNLADWKPFLGNAASAGVMNLTLNLLSQQGGKQLTIDLNSQVDNLTAMAGTNQIQQATVNFQMHAQARDLNQIDLSDYRLQLAQQGQPMLTATGSGKYDLKAANADVQVAVDASLPRLFQSMAQPDTSATAGTMSLKGHVVRKDQNQSITGNLTVADLTGRQGSTTFDHFGTTMDLDVAINNNHLQINKAAGTLQSGNNPGGKFDASGDYDLDKKTGKLTLNLVNLNQNGLRPFLQSALKDKQLVSITLNGSVTAGSASQSDSTIKADIKIANLVVNDPKQPKPSAPLEAGFALDASTHNQVSDLRQCLISLTPTERATNQLTLTGQVDTTKSNAIQGALKLTSAGLDLTHYYDIFAGATKPEAAKTAAPAAAPAPAPAPAAAANTEPPAMNLPFHNFTLDANIARVYLHEIEITNFLTTSTIEGSHAVVKPFQLSLNGAPVTAAIDLNLGVPGYQYDISFSANKVPIAPIANSLSPEYSGRAKGDLIANGQIKGAGTTGTSLQKTLTGQISLVMTNGDIQLSGPKTKTVVTVISAALRLPELSQSPINSFIANIRIGNGTIEITQFNAVGSQFSASSQGTITISPVLTNSPINNLPVVLALPVSLAKKAGLAPANLATNATSVDLGKIATVSGTLGDPKTKTDNVAIGLLTTKALGGVVGGDAGKILKGVGGLGGFLGGQAPAAPGTNQPPATPPSTNKPAKSNPFDLLQKVIPK
ncbi:MAG: hypothetical protein JWR26_777 [Pedosphaera sp.]|nr:hypothetical protein [Pedosphaera sp.]